MEILLCLPIKLLLSAKTARNVFEKDLKQLKCNKLLRKNIFHDFWDILMNYFQINTKFIFKH